MVNDVVLSSGLRKTILNFRQVQRNIDTTTLNLASGKRVNSALDNPQNFFAALALKQEASDLSRLVDGISQSIFTIQEADNGVAALTKLLDQAEAVSIEALQALKNAEKVPIMTGNVDLSAVSDLTADPDIAVNQTFDVLAGDGEGGTRTATFTITAGMSGSAFAATLNGLEDNVTGQDLGVQARLTQDGFLELRSGNGDFIRIESSAGNADEDTMTALGLGEFDDQFGNLTAIAARELRSQSLYRVADGTLAQPGDRLREGANNEIIVGEDGHSFNQLRAQAPGLSDNYFISVNGGAEETFEYYGDIGLNDTAISFTEFISRINTNENLNTLIEASFDEQTGQVVITPLSDEVTSITFRQFERGGDNMDTAWDFATGASDQFQGNGTNTTAEAVIFGSVPPEVTEPFEEDLSNLRDAIDQIVEDANYRGINLLSEENLITDFNADRNNKLITEGVDFTSLALGLDPLNYDNEVEAGVTISKVRTALLQVRDFGTTLANDLNILQNRLDFSRNTINTLQAGSEDLTVADQNEEGAKLLASQVRQEISFSVLSFAQSSQTSILQLF